MRWPLLRLVFLAVAVITAAAACSSEKNALITGFVSLDVPVSGATVQVESLDGATRYGGPVTTEFAGDFTLAIPQAAFPPDFRIVATGGMVGGETFDGTLMALVHAFEPDLQAFYRLNPVSTLISRTAIAQPALSPDAVRARVNRYLDVPDFIDLVEDDGASLELFAPAVFRRDAEASGGFDSFVAAMVDDIGSANVRVFRPVPLPQGAGSIPDDGGEIVKYGVESMAGSLGSSLGGDIGGFAAEQLVGFVMGFLFPTAPEPDPLEEVKGQLDEIKKELSQVNTRLASLENTAREINNRLLIVQYDQAIDQVLGPRNTINRNYTWLINQAKTASTARDETDLQVLRQQVSSDLANLLPADSPTDEAIGTIHQLITGDLGRTAILTAYIDRLREVLNDQNRHEVYASLESFFTTLITTEIKGVRVITEAYMARNQPLQAQSYLRAFYEEQLLPQLEVFVRTVDELVLSNRKTRWVEFLPDVESEMLASADLFVANVRNGANFDGQIVSPEPERRWAVARVAAAKGSVPSRITLLTSQGSQQVDRTSIVDSGPFSLGRYVYLNPPGDMLHFQGGGLGLSVSYSFGANPSATLNRAAWIPLQSDTFYIQGVGSGKNLEFTGASRDNGAHIQQWDGYGGDNQKWYIESTQAGGGGDKYYYNKFSNKVVDTAGGASTPGAVVWQWERTGAQGQRSCCYFTRGFDTFKLGSGFVALETTAGINGVNTVLIGSPGDGGSRWTAEEVEGDSRTYYKITNQATGKVLEVAGAHTGNGANIHQWQYLQGANQQWAMDVITPDTFVFINRHSGKVLDVTAASTLTGAQVYQWEWLNGDNQKWKLVKAD